jgi:hypothetical protein
MPGELKTAQKIYVRPVAIDSTRGLPQKPSQHQVRHHFTESFEPVPVGDMAAYC